MAAPTLAFDLDGTLVDTAPDLIATLNFVFSELDIPPLPPEQARPMIGNGIKPLIERGLGSKGIVVSAKDIDPIYARYLKLYSERIAEKSRPFPGAVAALDRLLGAGMVLAVCTNKLEWLAVKLLDELGISARFAAICGQDTFGIAKPNPEMLHRTVERAGGRVDRTVMIGDSRADVDLARAAGVPVIAVSFGYTDVPVSTFGPDRLIGHFNELAETVFGLLRS